MRPPPCNLAKQVLLGKALKAAHNRLHNHQLGTQLLNAMAPLRVCGGRAGGKEAGAGNRTAIAGGFGSRRAEAPTRLDAFKLAGSTSLWQGAGARVCAVGLSILQVPLRPTLPCLHLRPNPCWPGPHPQSTLPPPKLEASDLSGATQMLTSSFTLAKGMGDLNGQVAALSVLQQVRGGHPRFAWPVALSMVAHAGGFLFSLTLELAQSAQ